MRGSSPHPLCIGCLTIHHSTSSPTQYVISCDVLIHWNGFTYNSSGIYSWSGFNIHGCDSIANINFTINITGIFNISTSGSKHLVKITDVLGRTTKGTKNEPLFYIYNDGTVEKRIVIE